jgi:hypothetical protein
MKTTPAGVNSADIRKWAIANGYPQLEGKNGRLPAAAIQSFMLQHPLAQIENMPAPEGA